MIEDLKAVGKTPLSEKVYSTLVESIVKGTLPPGTKLQEQHVAKQLAVSATPVREAFRRMERDGFIESIPYCGVVVKELDYEEIMDAYACRANLELMAVREAVHKITDQQLDLLVHLSHSAASEDDFMKTSENSSRFHQTIYQAAGNKVLIHLMDSLSTVILRDMKYSAMDSKREQEILSEHKRIVQAFLDCDEEKAVRAMSVHLDNGLAYMKKRR